MDQKFCPYCWNWWICSEFRCFSWVRWSFMIKQYLNVTFKSVIWLKIITFWPKVGLKGKSGGVQLNVWREYGQKLSLCTMRDLPFNPTLCQNLMIIHQTIDLNMKFRYSWIINDHQIHEKHQNSPQIHRFQHMKIWTKWPDPFYTNVLIIYCYHMSGATSKPILLVRWMGCDGSSCSWWTVSEQTSVAFVINILWA